jgi:hypothetical protein
MDAVLPIPARWETSFLLNSDDVDGPSSAAFGHSGWGGLNRAGFAGGCLV